MTTFRFVVEDREAAQKAISIINDKFNENKNAQKVLYRKIKEIKPSLYECEFIFPLPDLRKFAWLMFPINAIVFLLFQWWIIVLMQVSFFGTAYLIEYMKTPHYLFLMLKKGLKKNGYDKELRRIL